MQSIVSIISPASSTALTTKQNVKSELNLGDTSDDQYIDQLIIRASSQISNLIGRPLGNQTLMETFRYGYHHLDYRYELMGSGSVYQRDIRPLILSYSPITSIVSVIEDSGTPLVQDTDYVLDTHGNFLWRLSNNAFSRWTGSTISVTYVCGWTLPGNANPTLPADIEAATISLIRSAYLNRGRDPSVILEVTDGVGRTGYSPSSSSPLMDESLQSVIARYRSPVW